MEQATFSSEAAKAIGIGVSTLRNYAFMLESKGYGFERGMNNGRMFRENDLELLKQMVERIGNEGMTIEQAAEAIMAQVGESGEQPIHVEKKKPQPQFGRVEQLCERIGQLEEQQEKLAKINSALAQHVESMIEKVEERERNQELLERLERSKKNRKRRGRSFLSPLLSFVGKKT